MHVDSAFYIARILCIFLIMLNYFIDTFQHYAKSNYLYNVFTIHMISKQLYRKS